MPKFQIQKIQSGAYPTLRYSLYGEPFGVALAPLHGKNHNYNGKGLKKPEPDVVAYTFPDLPPGMFKNASNITYMSDVLFKKLGLDKAFMSTVVKFYVRDYFHKHFDQHPLEIPRDQIEQLTHYDEPDIDFPTDYLQISWYHLVGHKNAPFHTRAKDTATTPITLVANDPNKCSSFANQVISVSTP